MVKGLDYYDTLGVSRDATLEEIRAAYFDAAKRLHPDVNPTKSANEAFLIVQEAYDLLINPMKRAAYDASLPQNPLATSVSINYQVFAFDHPEPGRAAINLRADGCNLHGEYGRA